MISLVERSRFAAEVAPQRLVATTDWLGELGPANADASPSEVLADTIRSYPEMTILTGASLGNLAHFLRTHPKVTLRRWVGQGGFAGSNVVADEDQLPKFRNMTTCSTFNLDSDREAAHFVLGCGQIARRELVSKNVCHGLHYNNDLHDLVDRHRRHNLGLNLIFEAMTMYLSNRPGGSKKFHDPLSACAAIDPACVASREVQLYFDGSGWGSFASEGSNIWISVRLDRPTFLRTLLRFPPGE